MKIDVLMSVFKYFDIYTFRFSDQNQKKKNEKVLSTKNLVCVKQEKITILVRTNFFIFFFFFGRFNDQCKHYCNHKIKKKKKITIQK